jgi:hypothetical protein
VAHWDGTSWSPVPTPGNPDRYQEQILLGVEAVTDNDIWAVGFTRRKDSAPRRPLAMHWNGTKWRKVPTLDLGPDGGELLAVSAYSGSDVWAVGDSGTPLLVEHFDGTSWSVVAAPTPRGGSFLGDIVALSATNAWAVGASLARFGDREPLTLTEHWNGDPLAGGGQP